MIDTIKLLFAEQSGQMIAQFFRWISIFAERLFNDDARPASVGKKWKNCLIEWKLNENDHICSSLTSIPCMPLWYWQWLAGKRMAAMPNRTNDSPVGLFRIYSSLGSTIRNRAVDRSYHAHNDWFSKSLHSVPLRRAALSYIYHIDCAHPQWSTHCGHNQRISFQLATNCHDTTTTMLDISFSSPNHPVNLIQNANVLQSMLTYCHMLIDHYRCTHDNKNVWQTAIEMCALTIHALWFQILTNELQSLFGCLVGCVSSIYCRKQTNR